MKYLLILSILISAFGCSQDKSNKYRNQGFEGLLIDINLPGKTKQEVEHFSLTRIDGAKVTDDCHSNYMTEGMCPEPKGDLVAVFDYGKRSFVCDYSSALIHLHFNGSQELKELKELKINRVHTCL